MSGCCGVTVVCDFSKLKITVCLLKTKQTIWWIYTKQFKGDTHWLSVSVSPITHTKVAIQAQGGVKRKSGSIKSPAMSLVSVHVSYFITTDWDWESVRNVWTKYLRWLEAGAKYTADWRAECYWRNIYEAFIRRLQWPSVISDKKEKY